MCLLIVEILMLIAGAIALFSGKLPAGLFKVLFGKGEYHATPRDARLMGLLLASPIPLAFVGGAILGLLGGGEALQFAGLLEFGILVLVCVVAVIFARKIKNQPPPEPVDEFSMM